MTLLWLILIALFVVAEFSTVVLISIWFAGGALAALIACLLGAAVWLQVLIFGLVSLGLLLFARQYLRKYVEPRKIRTNVDALVGKQALVVERVDNLHETGAVKLDGKIWTARSADGQSIPPDTVVTVTGIQGVKALVLPADSAD